jgi:hypothetical protein
MLLKTKPWPRMAAIRKGWDKGISGVVMDQAAQALGVVETGDGDGIVWALGKRSADA